MNCNLSIQLQRSETSCILSSSPKETGSFYLLSLSHVGSGSLLCLHHPHTRPAAILPALDSCYHLWAGSLPILFATVFTLPPEESFQCKHNYVPPLLITLAVCPLLSLTWTGRLCRPGLHASPTTSYICPLPSMAYSSAFSCTSSCYGAFAHARSSAWKALSSPLPLLIVTSLLIITQLSLPERLVP